ncbi:uncharacterized protein LOC117785748 [Drosophila innubila]|uniref:uncharacterized protein LOC117785748 n=1 Tax=Drosophila innubila TaxID=198719 RepID=UPI00148C38AA|nr:uncharacterized protein LOC117785748 [Drosophila innubila]
MDAKSGAQDKVVQCELLLDNLHGRTQEFDILDLRIRRQFVRRFYCLLILQFSLTIPCVEICLLHPRPFMELPIRPIYFACLMVIYTWLYIYRNWRRSGPFNYFVYLLTSITTPISTTVYLIPIEQTRWLHAYPLMLITTMFVLVFYTKQQKFKFSHAIGVIIIYLTFGMFLLLAYFMGIFYKILGFYACTLEPWYVIYDTNLMLCGDHGYNLQPREYLYAVGNIHADLPKFLWTIIRHFILGPIKEFIKILRSTRTKQIC